MRAWLEILRERYPGTTWIAEDTSREDNNPPTNAQDETTELLSAA